MTWNSPYWNAIGKKRSNQTMDVIVLKISPDYSHTSCTLTICAHSFLPCREEHRFTCCLLVVGLLWKWKPIKRLRNTALLISRVKKNSILSSFTRFLQGQNSLPLSNYLQEVYTEVQISLLFWFTMFSSTGSNQSLFFFSKVLNYSAKSVSWFTWCLHFTYMFLEERFTGYLQRRYCKHFTHFYMVSYPLLPKDTGCKYFLQ